MSGLPTGTVTFLFTDIEGSTRLWENHPQVMRQALARHDTLIRAVIEQQNGYLFKTMGDAFCAAFHTAPDALQAALATQQALIAEVWPEPVQIKVRMALHTGDVESRDNDYFGQHLNRVARMLSSGYGGQVLFSQATADLIRDALPPAVSLKAIGEHRLRDLNRPEIIFQLLHPDLPSDFPPLKSLDHSPNNLPRQLTSFIGREKEMAEIRNLLSRTSLLTFTGSGGCGKTRLALRVAADLLEQFPDGVRLVELASLADSALVPQAVASALNLTEQAGRTYLSSLTDYLKSKRLLLILDNCEHLLPACAALAEALLRACSHLKILATSREDLGIAGELIYRVPSLSVPDSKETVIFEHIGQYEAVRLFIERAQFQKPEFAVTPQNVSSLTSVCHRLDGIPLALELAAARIKSLTVEEIHSRLDNRFHLLTGGSKTALPRHQTLQALLDWSYELLNAQEQLLLARLSVFADSWTMEAAEQVCARLPSFPPDDVLDLLTSLVDKSLVLAEMQGETTRYHMLETVRQYALDRLKERGESDTVRARHRDHFLALAEKVRPKLNGSDQAHGLAMLEVEHDNLRLALAFCLEEAEGSEAGLRLATALQEFWYTRGHLSEGRQQLTAALSRSIGAEYQKVRADALIGLARLLRLQGDYTVAQAFLAESLTISKVSGDRQGVAYALLEQGLVAERLGDQAQARALDEESLSLFRELGDRHGIARCLGDLAMLAYNAGDYTPSRALLAESVEIFRELGDRRSVALRQSDLGAVESHQGNYRSACTLMEESIAIFRELGDRRLAGHLLNDLGFVTYLQLDFTKARPLLEEGLEIAREVGDRHLIATCLGSLGSLAEAEGNYALARALQLEVLETRRELGERRHIAITLFNLAVVAVAEGDYGAVRAFLAECLAITRDVGEKGLVAYALDLWATVACEEQRGQDAAHVWGAATSLRDRIHLPRTSVDQAVYDRLTAQTRTALGQVAFAVAFEAGRSMTWQQAVDYVLGKE